MRLTRHSANPILTKNSNNHWEAGSVFNPTTWGKMPDGRYGMLYRATNDIKTSERGGYVSSIGLAWSADGVHWEREQEPLIAPDQSYENSLGCEDPRITQIGNQYYIFYTAVAGEKTTSRVRIALATTTDFKTVTKYGVVGPQRYSKAAAVIPHQINGRYLMLWSDQKNGGRSRVIASEFDTLEQLGHVTQDYWQNADLNQDHLKIPLAGQFTEQEVGAVPIETDAGWLFIYAGFSREPRWTICAALLDRDNPRKIIAASHEPLLLPETTDEKTGVVNNVCFPEGALIIGEELYVYYGSGDQGVCLATCKLADLLAELRPA